MPHYFFNVHDGATYTDKTGAELADLAAARAVALRLTADLLRDDDEFWDSGDWKMDVTDASGLILFTLMFMALDAPALRREVRCDRSDPIETD